MHAGKTKANTQCKSFENLTFHFLFHLSRSATKQSGISRSSVLYLIKANQSQGTLAEVEEKRRKT